MLYTISNKKASITSIIMNGKSKLDLLGMVERTAAKLTEEPGLHIKVTNILGQQTDWHLLHLQQNTLFLFHQHFVKNLQFC